MQTIMQDYSRYHYLIVAPHIYEKVWIMASENMSSLPPIEFESLSLVFTVVDLQSDVSRLFSFLMLLEITSRRPNIKYDLYFSKVSKNVRLTVTLTGSRLVLFMYVFLTFIYKQYRKIYMSYLDLQKKQHHPYYREMELKWNKFLMFYNVFPGVDFDFIRTEILKSDVWVNFKFTSNYRLEKITRLLVSHYGMDFFV